MAAEPTFSVALPNYNHARYLPESLGAICEQSLKPKEVIVVDDGSTDGSIAVIEDFARRYPFVKLVRHARNMGAIAAFNRGIEESTGDFVLCPAADDKIRPGLFEKTMSLLARHPDAGLCSCLCWLVGEGGEELGPLHTPIISARGCFIAAEDFLSMNRRHGNWILSHTAFYNRKALQEWGGGFDPELGPAADGFLVYVLGARHGACFLPERLGSWRKLDTSWAASQANDLSKALALAELMDKKLAATRLFPDDFLDRSLRSALMAMLYEINRKKPYRFDEMALLGLRLRRRGLGDRFFFAFIAALKAVGRWASKLYLYLEQPPRARLRIAREKLAGFARTRGS